VEVIVEQKTCIENVKANTLKDDIIEPTGVVESTMIEIWAERIVMYRRGI